MKTQPRTTRYPLVLALAGLMALTRFQHGDGVLNPPDASLAVFFLAGCYLRPAWLFGAFFAEAALIDYLAVTYGGVSAGCFSPAYWFLIPTYACLWYAGRWYATRHGKVSRSTVIPLFFGAFAAASLAFLISNGGYYLFSGHVPSMSALQYGTAVARYYPPYVAATLGYLAAALTFRGAWEASARYRRRMVRNGVGYRHG